MKKLRKKETSMRESVIAMQRECNCNSVTCKCDVAPTHAVQGPAASTANSVKYSPGLW